VNYLLALKSGSLGEAEKSYDQSNIGDIECGRVMVSGEYKPSGSLETWGF